MEPPARYTLHRVAERGKGAVRVGISACLLGERVRWDGGEKRDAFLVERLGRFVEYVPVCPEVELGLGVPREPIDLVRVGGAIRLVGRSGADHTERMRAFAERRLDELAALDLAGFVLKRGSPSCGVERVRVRGAGGGDDGRGLFAAALMARMPLLPVEEEGRLGEPARRESFLERVFVSRRLRELFRPRWRRDALAAFHEAAELLLGAHAPSAWRALGRLVGEAERLPRAALAARYTAGVLGALARPATAEGHARVLRRAAAALRGGLARDEQRALAEAIEAFRRGQAPRRRPLAILREHACMHEDARMREQIYLSPYPEELE
jgi:uncharacterized protein YbbK (DUF523 family)/uncharacterized protein YbgA (DUF1722 family)